MPNQKNVRPRRCRNTATVAFVLLGALPFCTGCAGSPGESPPAEAELNGKPAGDEGRTKAEQFWEVYYIHDAKVGYASTEVKSLVEGGRKLLEITNNSKLDTTRFGEPTIQEMQATSVETPSGELVRFQSAGFAYDLVKGTSAGDQLHIEIQTAGKIVKQSIPWQADWGGYFAADRSLLDKPMQPGEQRALKALIPAVNQPCDITLAARDHESVLLLDGSRELLKIEATINLAGQTFRTTNWADQQGNILKRYDDLAGITTYRSSKSVALRPGPPAQLDLGTAAGVRVARTLPDPHGTDRIIYRAHLPNGDPATAFANGPGQMIQRIDDHTAEITVLSLRPSSRNKIDANFEPPTDQDRRPNSLIQSDDPRVVAMARSIAPDERDQWKLALALEQLVNDRITEKNFSKAFVSASEVVQSLEGDCTEHAVLLAALCRARGLPARVAIGLVYSRINDPDEGPVPAFAYHMWNEVYIGDRWIPLDAMMAAGGTGAAHLKLVDTHLDGGSALSAFLPVIKVIWQLELEMVEVE